MKGLGAIPSFRELGEAYQVLQIEPERAGLPELAFWSQWSRFDPRLGEQWISHLSRYWKEISPLAFREALLAQPWPAAAGVLLEQAALIGKTSDKRLFRTWKNCVMSGIEPAPHEQFFIGLRAFAGEEMRQDCLQTLKPYRRWGYFGREILLNKAQSRQGRSTWISASVRRKTLSALLAKHDRIRVQDYIDALEGAISRRQAQLDLHGFPGLEARGQTQGRSYRKRSPRQT